MSDGSNDGLKGSAAQPKRGSGNTKARTGGEDLPDILEIFGAAPLVREPPEPAKRADKMTTLAANDRRDAKDTPELWDPMASPADEPIEDDENDEAILVDISAPTDDLDEVGQEHLDAGVTLSTEANLDPAFRMQLAVEQSLNQMRDMLSLSESRLGHLEGDLQNLAKQTAFLPPKLRGIGKKVDELGTSVGDVRCRSLLTDVLSLGDLAESALKTVPGDHGANGDARLMFEAMTTRVQQILEGFDLEEVPTGVPFDPAIHNAVDTREVDEPALDGTIVEVIRRGFRSEHFVLRYAEVVVAKCAEEAPGDDDLPTEDEPSVGLPIDMSNGIHAPFLGATGTSKHEKSHRTKKKANKQSNPKSRKTTD
jgi:molecular chaperone GrpE (heat shock protein)